MRLAALALVAIVALVVMTSCAAAQRTTEPDAVIYPMQQTRPDTARKPRARTSRKKRHRRVRHHRARQHVPKQHTPKVARPRTEVDRLLFGSIPATLRNPWLDTVIVFTGPAPFPTDSEGEAWEPPLHNNTVRTISYPRSQPPRLPEWLRWLLFTIGVGSTLLICGVGVSCFIHPVRTPNAESQRTPSR